MAFSDRTPSAGGIVCAARPLCESRGAPSGMTALLAFDTQQAQALEALRSGSRFLLTGHVRPDGDCIGAQAALCRVLQAMGKEVFILNPDPLQEQFDYLAKDCRYRTYTGGDLPVHDWVVFLDFCELSRCGPLAAPIQAARSKKLIVDHHLFHGEPWWDAAFVDVRASATGLLVRRMARGLGVELDATAARGVFTSIVTDTGWFKYSNTDAETFAVAAELVERGVDPSALYRSIFQRNASAQPLAIARVLQSLEYFDEGRIAVVTLARAKPGEPTLSDSDEVLDLLRSVRSVEVVLFLRELEDGTCKLSARSKGSRDVNALARRFGGGGHAKASGATLQGALASARAQLVEQALALWAPGHPTAP
jgi:bifunctional oligoribonuclease and PAP phosphatase NrnA